MYNISSGKVTSASNLFTQNILSPWRMTPFMVWHTWESDENCNEAIPKILSNNLFKSHPWSEICCITRAKAWMVVGICSTVFHLLINWLSSSLEKRQRDSLVKKQLMRVCKVLVPPPFGFVFCGHAFDSPYVYSCPLKIAASTTNIFQRGQKRGVGGKINKFSLWLAANCC